MAIDEVGEFITTLFATPATRLTNCHGWTAHELVAHLAAGALEEAELIERHLAGESDRPTRTHAEREAPYRALTDDRLREQLVTNEGRLTDALERLAQRGPGDRVPFTGRSMSAADFTMHSRSECALHRWDLTGRDDIGWQMLGQPELTAHALTVLTSMSSLPEAPANRLAPALRRGPVHLVLRSEPHPDVTIRGVDGTLEMALEPIGATAADVELDPASRLLALWGRREPSAPIDIHVRGEARAALDSLFGW